jgi:hypothetical protein
MTTVQLTLNIPDSLAFAANQAGLFKPEAMEHLLREAVRKKAADELFVIADELTALDMPPMTMEEIQADVNAVRAARRASVR